MQLSKNFSLAELTKSQTAERMGLDNNPDEGQVENLRLLCERVLQPVRDHFNKVVTISSGYRSEINSNRKEYLMAIKTDGKTNYKPILGLSTDRYAK